MTRRYEGKLTAEDVLRLQLHEWLDVLDNVRSEERARCAESVACDVSWKDPVVHERVQPNAVRAD